MPSSYNPLLVLEIIQTPVILDNSRLTDARIRGSSSTCERKRVSNMVSEGEDDTAVNVGQYDVGNGQIGVSLIFRMHQFLLIELLEWLDFFCPVLTTDIFKPHKMHLRNLLESRNLVFTI